MVAIDGSYIDRRKNKILSATRKGDFTCHEAKRTSPSQAAEAKALAHLGYQDSRIADPTGLPARTVDDRQQSR